jgi:D-alanyl-D-alanine carboxypeptidase (penicillin-binding protein 5/6)
MALLLPSADDAAEDLAYNVGHGSVARFVGMMNARARQLHLDHTHYSTPIGLDTPGNYSSALDLVRLATYLLEHRPFFARVVALRSAVLRTGDEHRFVTNRNDLVGRVPWINGVKTGHTLDAGYVLVGSGTRDGMTLLGAVLGTPSEGARDADTLAVLGYGFANFRPLRPVMAGSVIARLPVHDQPGKRAAVVASRTFYDIVPREKSLRLRVKLPHQLAGPLPRHTVVGSVAVLESGRVLTRIPLLLQRKLPAASPLTVAANFVTRPLVLVLLLALAITATLLLGRARAHLLRSERGASRRAAPDAAPADGPTIAAAQENGANPDLAQPLAAPGPGGRGDAE